jgi:hypothetical protein
MAAKKEAEKKEKAREGLQDVGENPEIPIHILLQSWFISQTKWKNYGDIAKATDLDRSDVRKFFIGEKKVGMRSFRKLSRIIDFDAQKRIEEGQAEEKIEKVKDLLYALNGELEVFKKGTKIQREVFRKSISAPDVGYMMAIIRTLLEEDQFQPWLLKLFRCDKKRGNWSLRRHPTIDCSDNGENKGEKNIDERIEHVKSLLEALEWELDFFKYGSSNRRELFRKSIFAPDVGYIIALLRALFDEERFQTWLIMSNYKIRGK